MKLSDLITRLLLTAAAALSISASATDTSSSLPGFFRGSFPNSTTLRANLQRKAAQYDRTLNVISSDDVRRTPEEVEVEGELEIPFDVGAPNNTIFGGITGITYDDDHKVYYAITNDDYYDRMNITVSNATFGSVPFGDREEQEQQQTTTPTTPLALTIAEAPDEHRPRFYTIRFDDFGNTQILAITYLKDPQHNDYDVGEVSPQAIAYCDGQIFVSLDRGSQSPSNYKPQIAEYNRTGFYQGEFQYPDYFRLQNGGFTALTIDPNEDYLYAATGRGMVHDDPDYIRITEFNLETRQSGKQYVYQTDQTVVGMVALDENGGFAVLERSTEPNPDYVPSMAPTTMTSFDPNPPNPLGSLPNNNNPVSRTVPSDWEGYDVELYYARTLNALNVESVNDLKNVQTLPTIRRNRIYEWNNVTKFEAMGADGDGPDRKKSKKRRKHSHSKRHDHHRRLSDYEIDLIIMSNNEFEEKPTEVLLVELDLFETPLLKPDVETADVLDDGATGRVALDPAIWVHPNHPRDSLILGALAHNDIGVYNLDGELQQKVENDGKATGIDVMYAFQLADDDLEDIALVSDGTNNRVNAFHIRPNEGNDYLWGMTDGDMATIDNPTAIAAYHSPFTGRQYAFVVSNGNTIAQLELLPRNGRIGGNVVRYIDLPSNAGGLVVDNELGFLYVSLHRQDNHDKAILKYDAEPNEYKDDENYPQTVVGSDEWYFAEHDIQGLTMYYGDQGDGYLVVSVSGDSTFAVFERESDNEFYDSFTIGANRHKGIDKTDNTGGIAITNLKMGDFQCGVFVVQDFDNEQAKVDGLPVGELVNSNTNFKLVPFEELAENLYYYLDVDTDSWDPRRFSLVIWINCLAQEVYSSGLSGRDTESLLGYLNDAVRHLYPRSSKKQQMISLIDPFDNDVRRRRLGMTTDERRQETRRRILADEERTKEERRELKKADCHHRRRLKVDPDDAKDDMKDFIEHLEELRWDDRVFEDDFNRWKSLAEQIKDHIPE